MKGKGLYVARLIGWINFRYYVIEMHHRVYIIDYANPGDIRDYFPGFFPKHNRQYTAYDITDSRDNYEIRPVPWWQTPYRPLIEWWSATVVIVLAIILYHLGVEWLHNENVPKFWKIILSIYALSAVGIAFWLNKTTKTPAGLSGEKSYKLERKPQYRDVGKGRKVRTGPFGDFMLTLIGQPLSLIFMLNKGYLIIPLGFIAGYSVLFIRFLNIGEMLRMNKFIFLKEEDK